MNETYEEFKERMKTNSVYMTEEEFANTAAETMRNFDDVFKSNPSTFMLLTLFTAQLAKTLFHKNDNKEGK